jgi:hypothetical protein
LPEPAGPSEGDSTAGDELEQPDEELVPPAGNGGDDSDSSERSSADENENEDPELNDADVEVTLLVGPEDA